MFVVDTSAKEERPESVWREYSEDIRVKIRPPDKDFLAELTRQATIEVDAGYDRGRKITRKEVVSEKYDRSFYRGVIEDWEGVVDQHGAKLEPSPENIDLVCKRFLAFASWVRDEAFHVAESEAARKGELLKNSKPSPDGK